jgi:ribosome-binding protein aMBF1 (putative translation factor)
VVISPLTGRPACDLCRRPLGKRAVKVALREGDIDVCAKCARADLSHYPIRLVFAPRVSRGD